MTDSTCTRILIETYSRDVYLRSVALRLYKKVHHRKLAKVMRDLRHKTLRLKVGDELYNVIRDLVYIIKTARIDAYACMVNSGTKTATSSSQTCSSIDTLTHECNTEAETSQNNKNLPAKEIRGIFFNTRLWNVYQVVDSHTSLRKPSCLDNVQWSILIDEAKSNLNQYICWRKQELASRFEGEKVAPTC
jgi:hypothetical protein